MRESVDENPNSLTDDELNTLQKLPSTRFAKVGGKWYTADVTMFGDLRMFSIVDLDGSSNYRGTIDTSDGNKIVDVEPDVSELKALLNYDIEEQANALNR